ncbi:hypothetical protein UPYG_G00009830 [Umbra pygmaea]|uniref:C2H2-type domain-containing protein n=1 Tax=Umbra pygmaea TaxID=75934 RepID=A0ABD0XKQ4_UMBPY
MMPRTPPNKSGISFAVGAQLEARDTLKNWYQATIEKINYEEQKVLIHYRQWSHRYDEWFDWTSPYLRPLDRIQLRKEALQDTQPTPVFQVNEKVLACWVDCRYYPAKVVEVRKDASYTVKFFDGVVKTVKPTKIKPYKAENGTARERDRTRSEHNNRKQKSKENGKAGRGEPTKNSSVLDGEGHREDDQRKREAEQAVNSSVQTVEQSGILKVEVEEPKQPPAGQDEQVAQTQREEVSVGEGQVMSSTQQSEAMKEEDSSGQSPQVVRRNRYRASEESHRELRKRRSSVEQMPLAKRRPDVDQTRQSQSPKEAGYNPVLTSQAITPDQTNRQTPTDAGVEGPSDMEAVLKRQIHLPTTQKYSREPLYRVIKNQPPPILSIELDHNPFKCKAPDCLKSFRKLSLLHYHVKYYHADMDNTTSCSMPAGSQEMPRRRRTMSGSTHSPLADRQAANRENHRCRRRSLSERRKENQHTNSRPLEEREYETGEKVKGKIERVGYRKQKKLKRLKSTSVESDWSTASAEWSDEDMEAELDVTTPMSGQNVSMVTEGSDVVRCVCEVEVENDFMIQCDECLHWQHGTCMGLYEQSVPDSYTCYLCKDPPAQRRSQRYWYDPDWLSSGHMYGLHFLKENYSHQNAKKIITTHRLLGDVHHVFQVLHSLQLKMNILQTRTTSDLKLWCQSWEQQEVELVRTCTMETNRAPSPGANNREQGYEVPRLRSGSPLTEKPVGAQRSPPCPQGTYASYISSEHCYQKPRAYYPAVEQRLVVETRRGSELEDSMRSTENLLELEQRYGGPLDPDRAKLYPSSLLQDRATIYPKVLQTDKGVDQCKKLYVDIEAEVKTKEVQTTTDMQPDTDHALHQQWQINLLDHIEAMQNQVTHRMDLIEKELDVLESWLDYTGELEPPDPLTRLPQLKHSIRQMLADLGTVKQMSYCSSTT